MTGARVEGTEQMLAAFDRLGEGAKRHGARAIRATAEKIRADAVKSIMGGTKSGVVYERGPGQNLSATHQASAPGQAPATDTGNLVGTAKASNNGMAGEVKFTAPYAFWLEHGTMKMDARPFLAPAVEANAQFMIDRLTIALDKATQEFGK